MNKSLRESRIDAIKVLYASQISGVGVEIAFSNVVLDNDEVALKLALNVYKNKEEIDKIISSSLTNYSINRLNLVDKAIIEVATFEMMDGIDPRIAINEALEITKMYTDAGDKKEVAFNNKLLDNIKKNLGK